MPSGNATLVARTRSYVTELPTRLTDVLDLEHPIVQAPIGSATTPELAAAVANAGGLGTLAVTWREPAAAREAVKRAVTTADGPIGANVVVDPDAGGFDPAKLIDAVLAADPDLVHLSFGDPAPHVGRIHDDGALVAATVGSTAEAASVVDAGVDIVVAQGWEAGGHVQSEVATMPLVPEVADAVPDTPVIAAGGIGDGRGVAAALALGADGAMLGTRFVATAEAAVHRCYADRVAEADATETVYGEPYDCGWPGQPHRTLENETTERWEAAGRPRAEKPGAGDVVAHDGDGQPIGRYDDALATPDVEGEVEEVPLYAGQSAGLVGERRPARNVVETIATEARQTAARFES